MIMNIDEAIAKLQLHGYLVESRRKYEIGEIINAVFQDEEFKPGDKENEFVGTAMREYDVDTYYKWDPNTDTLLVTFNFGNAKLVFKDFTKNVKIKNVKGWWEDKLEAEMTPELEQFTEDVNKEWQDCFGY